MKDTLRVLQWQLRENGGGTDMRNLKPEDYKEPCCPLSKERYGAFAPVRAIPQRRVLEKLDRYMGRRDYAGAERHLLYWMKEAELGHDRRGMLLLCGELVGFYRKTANREQALARGEQALSLLEELDFAGSATAVTTLVNVATAFSAFGENERALALFEQAEESLSALAEPSPGLSASLCNNMAAACMALGRHTDAVARYERALETLDALPGSALEETVTCVNLADAVEAALGPEEGEARVSALLDRAWELLNDEALPRDGAYAFVCEKCAPGFSAHGFFAAAAELRQAAEEIYDRT